MQKKLWNIHKKLRKLERRSQIIENTIQHVEAVVDKRILLRTGQININRESKTKRANLNPVVNKI